MSDRIELIKIEDVIKRNLLSKYSPVYLTAKQLNLKFLMRYDSKFFYGPPIELIPVVDRLTSEFKIGEMLDLFSGTGSLAKTALSNGVQKATCVDSYIEALNPNLMEFSDRVTILNQDILKMDFTVFFDIVTIDPPKELISELIDKKMSDISKNTNLVIMWFSEIGDESEDENIENKFREIFDEVIIITNFGQKILSGASTDLGKKYLDYLKKNFNTKIAYT